MPQKRPAPRVILAENLRALIEHHKTTSPRVAEKAGIDRKSVNNMLNSRFNPDLDNVESVAKVFGLTAWHLLRHDLKDHIHQFEKIDELIEYYNNSKEAGQVAIMQVAAMAPKK